MMGPVGMGESSLNPNPSPNSDPYPNPQPQPPPPEQMGVQKFHTVLSVGGEPFYEVDSSFGWFLPAV